MEADSASVWPIPPVQAEEASGAHCKTPSHACTSLPFFSPRAFPDSLLAHQKRSSSSSSTAPGAAAATAAASAAEAGATRGGFAGADGGSAVKDERLSCGSAASSSSRVTVLSVYSEDGEGADGWSGIDCDNLNSYTVRDDGDDDFFWRARAGSPPLLFRGVTTPLSWLWPWPSENGR